MRHLLPPSILAVVVILVVFVPPWHRTDPKHEFMFEMYKRLAEAVPDVGAEGPSSEEIHDR
jgi:hypothetical protein